jgi:hypothetical protein
MIQEKAAYKKYSIVGPGGRKCTCCYPAPGPTRRLYERSWKKEERRLFSKLIREALDDMNDGS